MKNLKGRLQDLRHRERLIIAFAAVYLIWGSTYLAIRFAIETLPPLLMAGIRFMIAGAILYSWTRPSEASRPAPHHWRHATVIGGLLLLGGNGGVVWAEQRVPSGLTALLIATVPFWMVLLDWVRRDGVRPTGRVVLGLFLGFAGAGLLVGPGEFAGSGRVDLMGAGVLMLASLSWATGSLYSRRARLPESPLLTTAMEMLAGGVLLMVLGLLTGEGARLNLEGLSLRSLLSLSYLIVFGSLVGFTAYIWLLRHTTPTRASTYAYVNPVVAVILGWAVANEPLTPRTLVAAAVIVPAVALIISQRVPPASKAEQQIQLGSTLEGSEKISSEGVPKPIPD